MFVKKQFVMSSVYVLLSVFLIKVVSASVSVTTYADLTCTNGGTQLPNLLYATIEPKTKSQNIDCGSIIVGGFQETFNFYYYDSTAAPTSCSDLLNVTGTVNFTSVLSLSEAGTTINVDFLGEFTTGPYANLLVTSTVEYPTINFAQCNTTFGLGLLAGNIQLLSLGGPICNGIAVKKYCPGIHYANSQNVNITLPGLPPITLPI